MGRLFRPLLVMVAVLAGCAETYRIRPMAPDERAVLGAASGPLLTELKYPGTCTLAVSLNDVPARQLDVMPSSTPQSCLDVSVTSGALKLPRAEVRALVAHGLAHVQLGHARTTRRSATRLGQAGAPAGSELRKHTPEEEAAADRFAARLLNSVSLDPGGPDCLALSTVLERAVVDKDGWREWTEMHPTAPTRVEAARRACAAER
jgi:hypothetical protein